MTETSESSNKVDEHSGSNGKSSSSSRDRSESSASSSTRDKDRGREKDKDRKESSSSSSSSRKSSSSSSSSRDKDRKKDDRRESDKKKEVSSSTSSSSSSSSSSKRRRSRSRSPGGKSRDLSRESKSRKEKRRSRSRDKGRRKSKSRSRSRSRDRRRSSRSPRRKRSSPSRSRSRSRSRSPTKRKSSPSSRKDENDSDDKRRRRSGWDTVPSASGDASKSQAAKTISLPLTSSVLPQTNVGLIAAQQQLIAQQQAAAQAALQRTTAMQSRIYVGSLNFDLTEDEIKAAFMPFGPIKQINLAKDPLTGKSKGFAFIEYTYPEAATSALEHMNGFQMGGRPIKVGRPSHMMLMPGATTAPVLPIGAVPTLPTSPLLATTTSTISPTVLAALQASKSATLPLPIVPGAAPALALPLVAGVPKLPMTAVNSAATAANRIYIGSVPWDITENEIRTVFQPFGEIKSCSLMPNPETGKHKGFGFVEFDNKDSAEEAIKHMNGLILGGRAIKVGRAVTSGTTTSPGAAVPPINVALQNAAQVASTIANQLAQQKKDEDSLSKEENMTISGKDRYLIMQKLARGADMKTCRCIVLHNMVTIDDIDEELENEVSEECGKFGEVEKVVIYQEHQSDNPKDVIVKIYVIFKALESAHKAVAALNNRWFGGRIIRVELAHDPPFRI